MDSTLTATAGYTQHVRSVVLSNVSLLICGSIATDHLMTFQGRFKDSLVVEQLDKISVSFLVEDLEIRRGGVAPNMCFGLGRLGDLGSGPRGRGGPTGTGPRPGRRNVSLPRGSRRQFLVAP